MQASLKVQAAAAASSCRRAQQPRCQATSPMQPRAPGVAKPRVGDTRSQRNVAAHAKGAIKPMEATFTEFKLIDKSQKQDWIALLANAEFFFNDAQNEQIAENLRERVRYLSEKGEDVDMLFVCEPEWLERLFPEQAKRLRRPAVALLCPDRSWMTFMRIRLDRVIEVSLPNMSAEEVATCGQPVPKFPPPAKWTAPYKPYAWGWWDRFML
ncbi:hypothetical protein CHLNCDRAFT_59241 [Chlorella variabilis]|uniref:Uncharacterized protein n=1 Tax=Chlorella variabilis TaxID=554065 RepID=E1ZRW7_CHLVA|nr:hypothetical protein CHLNCDRAFT_59241 [Chlorella variabilis]EFN51534.1 hypothetical protein CHLNCDRAFT_59241 [Chlorella variabilis]|eukprot:XP_005843636.1 hypothetical protein CHLNCDRAFT_59241 [Chlorella variabilis]